MKAGSVIWALLPATTKSRTRSMSGWSVMMAISTPGTLAAAASVARSAALTFRSS